jgi:hypothetical protein
MRTVFLFFASLNVIFFLWQYSTLAPVVSSRSAKKLAQDEGVATLVLLREAKAIGAAGNVAVGTPEKKDNSDSLESVQTAMLEKPVVKKQYTACYTFGPFEEYLQLKSVTSQLSDLDADTIQRKEVQQVVLGHWVYLPSFPTWQDAHKKVTELEDKGVKDIFILGRGDMKNAVSLGLFKNEDGAKRRIATLRKLGIKPNVEVQETNKEIVWLDINVVTQKQKVETTLKSFTVVNNTLKIQNRKCK